MIVGFIELGGRREEGSMDPPTPLSTAPFELLVEHGRGQGRDQRDVGLEFKIGKRKIERGVRDGRVRKRDSRRQYVEGD